jgi:hypothetical protein
MDDEFIKAVEKTADTSFNVNKTFGRNEIAERRSGSERAGFYRPGERDKDGTPFDALPARCPAYSGPPSPGRAPTDDEKHGAWQLQAEYFAGRLGKNAEENSRLWNTAKWIDRNIRLATMPADATKSLNLCTDGWDELADLADRLPDSESGFEHERRERLFNIDQSEKGKLALKLSDRDVAELVDYFEESDELAKIDVNKLAREEDPLPEQIDLPGCIERVQAGKIVRVLMLGMRSLWHPAKRAIVDHAAMKTLGEGKGRDVAPAVGRQRVIEGLRIAESIRKGLSRQDRAFSARVNQVRASQEAVPSTEWRPSVDEIIKATLAILPMPVRATEGHYLDLPAGPVIRLTHNPLSANDNHCAIAATKEAA